MGPSLLHRSPIRGTMRNSDDARDDTVCKRTGWPERSGQPLFRRLYRVLADAIASQAFPRLRLWRFAGGQVVLQDALGRFTYEQDSSAVAVDTPYDVASLTKVVATTAASMLLKQRGLLDLDTPLGRGVARLRGGPLPEVHARFVKLRHLLAHSSGLPGYAELFRNATSPSALFRACLDLPSKPNRAPVPNTPIPAFILLGKALELVTGEELSLWTQREIFIPLACPPPASILLRPRDS